MAGKGTRRWNREETIICLDLYFRIPFSKSRASHSEVVKVAKLIDRSPAAVNLKVGQFGSLDPNLSKKGITGLAHTSALDRKIWKEFKGKYEKLAIESELQKHPKGIDVSTEAKRRIGQAFFRDSVLASYDRKCCITSIEEEQLLIASHIKPWSKCEDEEKTNPQNGLCLNALHDKAFDRGLITVNPDYKIKISKILRKSPNQAIRDFFVKYDGNQIDLPERLPPDKDFLDWHENNVFISG
ncbi:MAG: HNH endonuclease [Candidatus Dadabacteria bacterium]|nr:HNH endonuclease [Candidatus Dadabacteria bacterium]